MRLKSELWVKAYIRRCRIEGADALLMRRGDADAGAIYIKVSRLDGTALLFGPAWVHYRIWRVHRSMPLLLGLGLVALFIWFAENIGTLARAWHYPNQKAAWELVPLTKLGSWFLLMIISYTLVAAVNGVERYRGRTYRAAPVLASTD